MKEMLRVILDMDKQASRRVKEAEAYRDKEIAELRTEGDAYLRKIEERNRHILDGMDALYGKNAENWVNTIVENVTQN